MIQADLVHPIGRRLAGPSQYLNGLLTCGTRRAEDGSRDLNCTAIRRRAYGPESCERIPCDRIVSAGGGNRFTRPVEPLTCAGQVAAIGPAENFAANQVEAGSGRGDFAMAILAHHEEDLVHLAALEATAHPHSVACRFSSLHCELNIPEDE